MAKDKRMAAAGALIEQARRLASMTQDEAARRSSMSNSRWRQIVKGYTTTTNAKRLPLEVLVRMAHAVDLAPAHVADALELPREDRERFLGMARDYAESYVEPHSFWELPGRADPVREPGEEEPAIGVVDQRVVDLVLATVSSDRLLAEVQRRLTTGEQRGRELQMFHRAVGRGRGLQRQPEDVGWAPIEENMRLTQIIEDAPGVEHDESWSDLVEVIENAIDSRLRADRQGQAASGH